MNQTTLFDMPEPNQPLKQAVHDSPALKGRTITVEVELDDMLAETCKPFDYSFDGKSTFILPEFNAPKRDGTWNVGLIVGPSGSGKSQLLRKNYGETLAPEWNHKKAIASQFGTHEAAMNRLAAVGLNSVPSWCRPYHVLSNGEQFRARMARMIDNDTGFDEFTSVVDRTVAKSCSWAIQRYIRREKLTGIVFATCHYDVLEWLQPDWTFDTLTGNFVPKGCLQRRPSIQLSIEPCARSWWNVFKHHHYLSEELNQSAETFLAKWDNRVVGFMSALAMPSGTTKNAWRGHRTVVLPDYQGLGIGVRLSDWVAQRFINLGRRYYSRTSHARMAEYRNASPLWRKTASSGKPTSAHTTKEKDNKTRMNKPDRAGFSHEFIGKKEASQ